MPIAFDADAMSAAAAAPVIFDVVVRRCYVFRFFSYADAALSIPLIR